MVRGNRILYAVIILSVFLLFTTGCDKYQRYKTLTFFFTGVPHPDEEIQAATTRSKRPLSLAEKAKKRREKERKDIKIFTHGPYGSKQCYQCHATEATTGLSKQEKRNTPMPKWSGRMPGRLLGPLKQLCQECHVTKSAESAYNRDLWIHGPVSDGMCTLCHSPHQTKYPYMLVQEKTTEICKSCHGKGFIVETKEHTSGEECIACHNAHLGKNRYLLKKDFEEIF
jgi:predicted CXXCH cytochrome family protein